jgi:hypothetical protein
MNSVSAAPKFNPGLSLLLRMNIKGQVRGLLKSLFTFQGAVLALVAIGYIYFGISDHDAVTREIFEPVIRLGGLLILYALLAATDHGLSERGNCFSDAEAQFVLTAPVTSKELVSYVIAKRIQTAFIFALAAILIAPNHFIDGYVRILAGAVAATVFPLAILSLCQYLAPSSLSLLRKVTSTMIYIAPTLYIGAFFGFQSHYKDLVLRILDSNVTRLLLFPFNWASTFLFQEGTRATLIWVAVAGVFASLCIGIAYQFLNFSDFTLSEHREINAKKAQKTKKNGLTLSRIRIFESDLPDIPTLGGTGPILWRRCQEASRQLPYLLALALLGIGYSALPLHLILGKIAAAGKGSFDLGNIVFMSQGIAMMVAFIIASFDFNADIRKLEWLKSLPMKPGRVVIGQIALSSLYLFAFMALTLLVDFAIYVHYFPKTPILNAALIWITLSIPLAVLYMAAANALFLLAPNRGSEQSQMIKQFQVFCGFAVLTVFMFGFYFENDACALLANHLNGGVAAFTIFLGLIFLVQAVLALQFLVWTYERFDVSSVSR